MVSQQPYLATELAWREHKGSLDRRGPIRILELRAAQGAGGGPEKTILLGAARTDPERYSVTVCYIRRAHDNTYEIDERAHQLGVDYIEVPQRGLVDRSVLRTLRRLVRSRAYDIVHAHDYKTDLLALLLARSENVIPLATAHGWTGHSFREKLVYYPIDKRLLRNFPRVIAVSSEIRDELLRTGARPDQVTVVLNGIDHREFRRDPIRVPAARSQLGIRDGEMVLGAMGRLEPQKRFDILLEAFATLSPRRPRLRLLIAGEGSRRHELESMASRLGIAAECHFLGHYEDVIEFHHAIDLFVQSSAYEGTPNVVLEAMALETPLVATNAGGTAEVVTDAIHGVVVSVGDGAALARGIERTLDDSDSTRQRVQAARRRVEDELSFSERMRRIEAIYAELVSAPRRHG